MYFQIFRENEAFQVGKGLEMDPLQPPGGEDSRIGHTLNIFQLGLPDIRISGQISGEKLI